MREPNSSCKELAEVAIILCWMFAAARLLVLAFAGY